MKKDLFFIVVIIPVQWNHKTLYAICSIFNLIWMSNAYPIQHFINIRNAFLYYIDSIDKRKLIIELRKNFDTKTLFDPSAPIYAHF